MNEISAPSGAQRFGRPAAARCPDSRSAEQRNAVEHHHDRRVDRRSAWRQPLHRLDGVAEQQEVNAEIDVRDALDRGTARLTSVSATARHARRRRERADRARCEGDTAAPDRRGSHATAVFGIVGMRPGRIVRSASMSRHQPISTSTPTSTANAPADGRDQLEGGDRAATDAVVLLKS